MDIISFLAYIDPRTHLNNLAAKYRLAIQYASEGPYGPLNNCYWVVKVYGACFFRNVAHTSF
jgi:hypothetical protein